MGILYTRADLDLLQVVRFFVPIDRIQKGKIKSCPESKLIHACLIAELSRHFDFQTPAHPPYQAVQISCESNEGLGTSIGLTLPLDILKVLKSESKMTNARGGRGGGFDGAIIELAPCHQFSWTAFFPALPNLLCVVDN